MHNPKGTRVFVRALTLAALAAMTAGISQADPVTAVLTADNHYGLYHGSGDGSVLTFVGRNEFGFAGSPGAFNWSLPETFPFNATGDYLYVVAWDDGGPQMWTGDFTFPASNVVSNTTDWEWVAGSGANPMTGGAVPCERGGATVRPAARRAS